jgi:hypothetical protein
MTPPKHWSPGKNDSGWRANMCDIMLFDEEGDRHVIISWELALKATMCTDATNGNVGGTSTGVALQGSMADAPENGSKVWANLALAWSIWNTEAVSTDKKNEFHRHVTAAHGALNAAGKTKAGAVPAEDVLSASKQMQYSTLMKFPMPVITICRPFLEHLMHSCILTVAGRDTGATLFGPADMQLSANTQVKTIDGHYTGHFKAVITKPQNVYVLRDVACAGYVAGGNCIFFGQQTDQSAAFNATLVKEDIEKRLAFSEDVGARYGSLLAFPMFEDQLTDSNSGIDTVMSVSGRLLPWEVTGTNSAGMHNSFPGGEAAFQKYSAVLGLRAIHFGEDLRAAENQDFISQGSTNNSLCFLGPHRKYDPFSGSFYSLTPGQGHFGSDAIPGVSAAHAQTSRQREREREREREKERHTRTHARTHARALRYPAPAPLLNTTDAPLRQDARWRRGESVSLRSARDNMNSLELVAHARMAYGSKD